MSFRISEIAIFQKPSHFRKGVVWKKSRDAKKNALFRQLAPIARKFPGGSGGWVGGFTRPGNKAVDCNWLRERIGAECQYFLYTEENYVIYCS